MDNVTGWFRSLGFLQEPMMEQGSRKPPLSLLVSLLFPLAAGGIGSVSTMSAVPTWYRRIYKPVWTPPSWLFAPVWTTLYLAMGVASWLVWKKGDENGDETRAALTLYSVQLGFNSLWSIIFFGLRSPGLALAEIAVLWGLIVATVRSFARVRPLAAALLAPYLAWTTFAAALNAAIWWLNRDYWE